MTTETAAAKPALDYWRVYVDAHGISHQERCTLADFERQSMGGAAPQWNAMLKSQPSRALFCVLPVGWIGDWHENPVPQWIVPLSGRWFVETMDGTHVEMGPGEVSFGGDQGCVTDADGRKGHRSGTLGDEPAVLMLVQMNQWEMVSGTILRQADRYPHSSTKNCLLQKIVPDTISMSDYEIIDSRFRNMVLPNAPLEKLADGFRWLEGPVWFADKQCLLFSDIPNDRILRWTESGSVSVFRQPSRFANGHTRDREGRLVGCLHGGRAIVRTELDGGITTLADRYQGKRLNSPNDVVVKSDGTIWFSDPPYGIQTDYEGGRRESELPANLYRFDPRDASLGVVADDFAGPNGLCFSPDEKRLYVTETGLQFDPGSKRCIRVFEVGSGGKSLCNGRDFHKVEPGDADGIRCDEDGNLWSSAGDGVHCIAADGTLLGKIRTPCAVSNLCFGDRHYSRLFLCATQTLYAIWVNRRGAQRP